MMRKPLTTVFCAPFADNQNIKTAGPLGPALLRDVWFMEKLAHFDREVIPERRMHAKGLAAFGTFTATHDITQFTRAQFFAQVGKKTEVFSRFSTVAGERGATDAERDTQRYRLAVNYAQIPVNYPRAALNYDSYHRDGAGRVDGNHGGKTSCEPNTRGKWAEQPDYREPPLSIEGAAGHWNHGIDDDCDSQPGALFRKMSPAQKQALFENSGVSRPVQELHIQHCALADPDYGRGIAEAIERIRR
jgi:catalase